MRFRPVLLLGLGSYGSDIASRIAERIRAADPATAPLVGLLKLHDDGTLVTDLAAEPAQIAFDAASTYAGRFSAIAAAEEAISHWIVNSLDGLRRRNVLVPLREMGYDIDAETSIYFVAPLCDDVGSVALIGFLEIVRGLSESRLKGQQLHRTVLCFFPDLFPDYREDDARYARSYVCLQELEYSATARQLQETLPYDYVSLFTARNEDNEDLGSYTELADALGEIYGLALRREITVDESFASALINRVEGKVTRFSSVGMSKLIFSREAISRALDGHFASDVLHDIGYPEQARLDRQIVSSDVRAFIFGGGLQQIAASLANDRTGKPTWRPFTTRAKLSDDAVRVEDFLKTLGEDVESFERKDLSAMMVEVREVRARLTETHAARLMDQVGQRIDQKGGPGSAHAFLDVLLNKPSEYTAGDTVDDAVSADDIDRSASSYFDNMFGIRRGDLSRLQQEINSKAAVLRQYEADLASGGEVPKELEETIAATTKQLETLRKTHAELDHQTRMHDLQMQDGAQRRLLLGRRRDDLDAKIGTQTAELEPLDRDYRDKRRALEAERQRRDERRNQLVLYLVLVVIALALLDYLVRRYVGPVSWSGKLFGAALLGYLIWAAVEYWKARAHVVVAFHATETAAARKRGAFLALVTLHQELFKAVYEFALHGAAVDWATDFKREMTKLRSSVGEFNDGLRQLYEEERAAFTGLHLPQSILSRNVAGTTDVERFREGADRYGPERARFAAANPLSKTFTTFRESGSLANLVDALRGASTEVFAAVRGMSIERFLSEGESGRRLKISDKTDQLFQFGAPLVQLAVEGRDDHLRNVAYLGTVSGESSPLAEAARKRGFEPMLFRTRDDTEVVLVTVKVGFPAYHVALVTYCDHKLQASGNVAALQCVPEWTLESLIPSSLELGTEGDPSRQLACQSLALGIVKETERGFMLDEEVLGPNYRALIDSIRSLRGSGLKARLQVRIAEALKAPNVSDTIGAYLNQSKRDEIDQQIIQRMLDETDD
jgi:hypothetical protein